MIKAILTILTVGFFSLSHAQDKALLYEVTGKGLAEPSYLYGTFHLVCPTDLQVTDAARKAMGSSKQLYLELDFDDPGMHANLMKSMMLTGGKSLKELMKPTDYATVDGYLVQNMGVGLTQFGNLKPFALLSFMFVTMLKCEPVSYDLAFAQMAGKDKKEVLGLETIEEQLAALDKIPLDEQIKSLVDMVNQPDEAKKELMDLITAYKAQDLPALMKLMRDSKFDGESSKIEEELLEKRNTNWIPLIEKAAQSKATFFAFGAGHLAGDKGVITLLRQKGYTVKAVQ